MIKKIFLPILLAVLLAGCGGGESTPSTTSSDLSIPNTSETQAELSTAGLGDGGTSASTAQTDSSTSIVSDNDTNIKIISPSEINLTKAIQEGNIIGYDATDPVEDQYLAVINYLRSLKVKCNDSEGFEGPVGSDLEWNALLENAAKEHSQDMLLSEHYGHEGSGTAFDITGQAIDPVSQSTPFERMIYNGYDYSTASENIAMTAKYPNLESDAWITTMEAWMKSDTGHCSNIMNPNFTDFGMYESRGTSDFTFSDGVTRTSPVAYWTQNFGKSQ